LETGGHAFPEAFCAGSLLLFCAETTVRRRPEEWFEETCDGAWQSPLNHRRNSASFKPVPHWLHLAQYNEVDFSADAELSSAISSVSLGFFERTAEDVLLDVKVRNSVKLGI